MQRLLQIVSKIMMLAMLFTVLTSSVNADSIYSKEQPTSDGCRMTSAKACHATMCNVNKIDEHNSSPSCCIDHDCHANSVQFAILTHLTQISVPSTGQVFTELVGERQFFYDVILRPPVLS
mgnify:CR=1 FL=1